MSCRDNPDQIPATEESPPLVLEIKGNSLDDGPGIRTVVFFKGCPLGCVWCHNPESKRVAAEISFDGGVCAGCDECLAVCRPEALNRETPGFVDREKCSLCFSCVDACPSGALERVGREMTVEEIVTEIAKDRIFFDTSGGGATFSGGEPTLYQPFLARVLQAVKKAGVHTLIETCGLFDWNTFAEQVLPCCDAVYFDLKLIDAAAHRRYCGVSNKKILGNFGRLSALAGKGRLDFMPRVPLVPGITATEENLSGIAGLLVENGHTQVRLLDYNPLWGEKSAKLGAAIPHAANTSLATWMPAAEVASLHAIFHRNGIQTKD